MWWCYYILILCMVIPCTLFIILSFMWWCYFHHVIIFVVCVLVFLTHCSSFYTSCGDAVSATFSFYVCWYSSHIFITLSIMYWCRFCNSLVLCAGIPHILFIILSIVWWCCFRHIYILYVLVFLTHFSLQHPSCIDAVLPHFSFVCWYSSHIVLHSIHHVVMLFPPQIHFMCAGIPHTFLITLSIMYWCCFCHITV